MTNWIFAVISGLVTGSISGLLSRLVLSALFTTSQQQGEFSVIGLNDYNSISALIGIVVFCLTALYILSNAA